MAGNTAIDGEKAPTEGSQSQNDSSESLVEDSIDVGKPQSDIFFAFGPPQTYFLRLKEHYLGAFRYAGDQSIAQTLVKLGIRNYYCVAATQFGDGIVTYENHDGVAVAASWEETAKHISISEAAGIVEARKGYRELHELLKKEGQEAPDKLHETWFTIGPGGSWCARLSDGVHHHKLPANLAREIAEQNEKGVEPFCVALGLHGSYVALWSDDTRSWWLQGYEDLAASLNKVNRVAYVSLSLARDDNYFTVLGNGITNYNVRSTPEGTKQLDAITNDYMLRRAKRDGSTISFTHKRKRTFQCDLQMLR